MFKTWSSHLLPGQSDVEASREMSTMLGIEANGREICVPYLRESASDDNADA